MKRHFREILEGRFAERKFVCVGLDSDYSKIPECILRSHGENQEDAIFAFNVAIIDATKNIACAYKPNSAFYEQQGVLGIAALNRTMAYLADIAPHTLRILDFKRADIGNTNRGYVRSAFDLSNADAITINPYLGAEALGPFLERDDKLNIVLCRTSNAGAREFQDLPLQNGKLLYQHVAEQVAREWNKKGNCALVAGATYPLDLRIIRELAPDLPLLIPGIGKQGGDLEKVLQNGLDKKREGVIINSSSAVIFASSGEDFAEKAGQAAKDLHNQVLSFLEK